MSVCQVNPCQVSNQHEMAILILDFCYFILAIIVHFPMKLSEYLLILEHCFDPHSTMVTSGPDTSAQSILAVTDGRQL